MRKVTWLTFMAAALLFTTMLGSTMPGQHVYADQSNVSLSKTKLSTKEQAIARAKELKLIPSSAEIIEVREEGKNNKFWILTYSNSKKDNLSGMITLAAASGDVLQYSEQDRGGQEGIKPDESNSASNKISSEEAIDIAHSFVKAQPWKLNVEWRLSPHLDSDHEIQAEDSSHQNILFEQSHKGIHLNGQSEFRVEVDMVTGNITGYRAVWNAFDFAKLENVKPIEQIQAAIFDRVKPELAYYYIDEQRVSLLYSLRSIEIDAMTGQFLNVDDRLVYNPDRWKPVTLVKNSVSTNKNTTTGNIIDEQTARASAIAYLQQKVPDRVHFLSEDYDYTYLSGEEGPYRFHFIIAINGIPSINDYVNVEIDAKSGKPTYMSSTLSNYNYPKQSVPTVTPERAKRLLLSLYDVQLQYQIDSEYNVRIYYHFTTKPDTPHFIVHPDRDHLDTPPYVDATDGVYRDFLGGAFTEPMPSASQWLKKIIADPKRINYKVAVVLDGKLMKLQDEPIIRNYYTLMPFRELLQGIGATFEWDGVKQKVTAKTQDTVLELTIGSDTAYINGKPYPLGVPSQLVNQRTYVPARFVANALGATVDWESESRLVVLQTDKQAKPLTEDELEQLRYEAEEQWEAKHWQ